MNELRSPTASSSSSDEYLINSGDTVNIRVFEQDAMSSRVKVRADGKVALPIIGDTEVRGKRPSDFPGSRARVQVERIHGDPPGDREHR